MILMQIDFCEILQNNYQVEYLVWNVHCRRNSIIGESALYMNIQSTYSTSTVLACKSRPQFFIYSNIVF